MNLQMLIAFGTLFLLAVLVLTQVTSPLAVAPVSTQRREWYVCLLIMVLLIVGLTGCQRFEAGPELTERATVVDLPYVPAGHGSGVGFSTGGNMTVTSVDIPARYSVVFQCEHGRFVVNRQDLWKRLRVGQEVTVRYRELYRVEDDGRHLYDLDFLGAE